VIRDPLEQVRRHLRQLDPFDRADVEVERREHDVKELMAEREEHAGVIRERSRVQTDVGAVVIDQPGALASCPSTIAIG
jgi:hypothetical protein